ncbi:MAG: alpha/beta fold hydrolase [Actinomycetota bacterium]
MAKELTLKARLGAIRHTIALDSGETVYYEYPGNESKTLVLIHGYRGNHRGLEGIAGALKFRVLIPDLPGFGDSPELKTEHTVSAYAKWLREFLEAIGSGDEAIIVGHSFGTLVVGHYLTEHPALKAVLINPVSAPALSGPRAIFTQLAKAYYALADWLPERIGEALLRWRASVMVMSIAMAKTKNRELRSWIHRQHLDNFSDFSSVRVASEGYLASISENLGEMAKRIETKVLIIATELDDITGIEKQREVVKLYPDAQLREISGVGHLTHYEAPEIAAQYIEEFIEGK